MPIGNARQVGASYSQAGYGLRDAYLAEVIPQYFSGMRWIENHNSVLHLSQIARVIE